MKHIITLLPLLLSFICVGAKEYSFEISPANEQYRFVVEYDTSSKEFSLIARQDNSAQAGAWLLLGSAIPVVTQDEPVYKNVPGVTLSLSSANNSWKGKAGELLFLDKKGNVLFGAYVDEEKIGTDKRRRSYAIVNTKSGLKKWDCSVMLREDYAPYDELYAIAKAGGGPLSAGAAKTALPQAIKDYIINIWGCFDVKTFADYNFKNIENALSSRFTGEINVRIHSRDYWTYELYNPPIKFNGRQPYYISFSKSDDSPVHLSYSYLFKFGRGADAENFAGQMRDMIMQQCGFNLDNIQGSNDKYRRYHGNYYYNNLKYSVLINVIEVDSGELHTDINISVFP